MKKLNNAYALRKRILSYIYIDPDEPHWDIFRYIGSCMFYIGCILLLYDYIICDSPYVLVLGKWKLDTFLSFMINPQVSQSYFLGTSQAWLFFLFVGGGMDTLGRCLTNTTKKKIKQHKT